MTDDIHIDGHDGEEEFEREDLRAKPVILFLVSLTVGCLLVALLLKGMYSYLDARENRRQPALNPLVQPTTAETRRVAPGDVAKFPEPHLETDEPREINDFRMHEEQALHSYGWIDQSAGVVRIPIDRAMELLAQRGLPTRPQAGTVPPSEINMVKQAARRSDTSRQPAKKN
ncbi:MAG: hypothetical protein WBQ64_00825 [Terriglobales bacterium]|jgi:hypothetical protein